MNLSDASLGVFYFYPLPPVTDPKTGEEVTITDIEDVFSFKVQVLEYTDGGYNITTKSEHSIRRCRPSDFEQFDGISEEH